MKALVLLEAGAAPRMEIQDRANPAVAPHHSLVRIHAATLNPLSNQIRTGIFGVPKLPLVLSNDGVGVIEQSDKFAPGTRVIIYGGAELGVAQDGLQQEFIAVHDKHLIELPSKLSMEQGAALPINYVTSFQAMNRVSQVQRGDYALISGASGAVGQALIQTALAMGALPIAVVSNPEKIGKAKSSGAHVVIDLSTSDLKTEVLGITNGNGADLAFDTVGGSMTGKLVSSLKTRGAVVCIGFIGGTMSEIDISDIVIYEKKLLGYDAHLETQDDVQAAFKNMLSLVEKGLINPEIDSTYSLDEYETAYARLNSRKATGAVLIRPSL